MQTPIGPASGPEGGTDVEQYKRQAKELLKEVRLAGNAALARVRAHHPQLSSSVPLAAGASLKLADAQLVIAREHGFASWPRFAEYLRFRNAVEALDAGDVSRLESLIDEHPSVLRYECRVGEWYEQGYFSGARLLWHIAGNPARTPLPRNVVDVARALVTRRFTQQDAQVTIGLLLTSRQASEAGVALALIDLLASAGAHFDVHAPDVLAAPLLNHAPATAESLVRRGAKVGLREAAALGELSAMTGMLSVTV
jgi:hypothetical protein